MCGCVFDVESLRSFFYSLPLLLRFANLLGSRFVVSVSFVCDATNKIYCVHSRGHLWDAAVDPSKSIVYISGLLASFIPAAAFHRSRVTKIFLEILFFWLYTLTYIICFVAVWTMLIYSDVYLLLAFNNVRYHRKAYIHIFNVFSTQFYLKFIILKFVTFYNWYILHFPIFCMSPIDEASWKSCCFFVLCCFVACANCCECIWCIYYLQSTYIYRPPFA